MPMFSVRGVNFYYERSGDGPRLLFLNGSGASIASGGPVLDRLRGEFDLAVHDQRGLGATDVAAGPYSMAGYASDAVALVDHLGWETTRVIGISFGGMVAQELAVTYPERVSRLALVCTSPGGAGGSSYPLHARADVSEDQQDALTLRLLDNRFTPEWLADHPQQQQMADFSLARRRMAKTDGQLRGEALQLDARSRHDVWDRLPRIACPTLVACGRYDDMAQLTNGEAIAARVAGARLDVFEGGHAFFFQDRSAFPAIIEFLRG